MKRWVVRIAMVFWAGLGAALAQGYAGSYTAQGELGTVTLVLQQSGDALTGTLSSSQAAFTLEGQVYPDGAAGTLYVDGGILGFEIYVQGDALGLYLFDLDANGNAITETASEIIMTRQSGAAPAVGGPPGNGAAFGAPPGNGPAGGNPAGAGSQGAPGANPLGQAAADPVAGRYSDGNLTVTLAGGGGQYGGELAFGGRTYPVTARGTSDHLSGSFLDGAQAFEFTATVLGGTMRFETDGAVFVLQREAAGAAGSGPFADPVADPVADPFAPAAEAPGPAPSPWGPAPGGPSPAGGGLGPAVSGPGPAASSPGATASGPGAAGAPTPADAGPVVAQGQFAALTQDALLAFVEALEFSMAQLGYADSLTDAERQEAYEAVARAFPHAGEEEQLILAGARETWTQARQQWHAMPEADQQEFVLAVLVLAFGEEAVRQLVGPVGGAGSGPGGGACATFEDCAGGFVDQGTWNDTMNAQSCWAAAGCDGYDAGSDTFYMDESW